MAAAIPAGSDEGKPWFRRICDDFWDWRTQPLEMGVLSVERLALWPGFSARARVSPTALCATRREAGLLVLTAGPLRYSSIGVIPPARWLRPYLIERTGVVALLLARHPSAGDGKS